MLTSLPHPPPPLVVGLTAARSRSLGPFRATRHFPGASAVPPPKISQQSICASLVETLERQSSIPTSPPLLHSSPSIQPTMLPSRGVLRSLSSARATSSISSQFISRSPRRLGNGRQFGTSLRSTGALWAALRPATSRLGGSGLAGTAAALAGSLETRRAFSLWNSKPKTEPAPPATQPTPEAPAEPPIEHAAAINAAPEPAFADAAAATTPSTSFIPELDAAALLDLPEQIGFLRTLGLDFGWGPSSVMQWILEHIHVYSGLPWWASIAATGVLLRLVMFKPLLKAQDTSARLQKLQQDPRYLEVRNSMQEAMSRGDSAGLVELRRDLSMMNKRAGVNPANSLWGLLQIPFGYGMFRVLNGAASIPVPGMETGGFLWISDLTASDPFFILPIAASGAMFAMVKVCSTQH
ncbi:hypothetical protein LX36DRAFT_427036, partial [Colletotrichum falcatum]